ncbi:hypothetical protein ACQPZJ_13655 [Actinoplanes sp. CA-054009]
MLRTGISGELGYEVHGPAAYANEIWTVLAHPASAPPSPPSPSSRTTAAPTSRTSEAASSAPDDEDRPRELARWPLGVTLPTCSTGRSAGDQRR